MIYFVYVLKSSKNNRYYTGSTKDLRKRLKEHNSGKSAYTRLTRPFELIYYEKYPTRKEAVKREREFKTGKGREELKQILLNFSRGIAQSA